MGQTANYGLEQWGLWELPRRAELNQALAQIDAALGALEGEKARLVTGTYTGNDGETRTISLGFTPKALLVENQLGERKAWSFHATNGGLVLPNRPLLDKDKQYSAIAIVTGGFQLRQVNNIYVNQNNMVYFYLAVR